jgi:hypothetical protein
MGEEKTFHEREEGGRGEGRRDPTVVGVASSAEKRRFRPKVQPNANGETRRSRGIRNARVLRTTSPQDGRTLTSQARGTLAAISSSAAKRKERERLTMSPLQRGVRPLRPHSTGWLARRISGAGPGDQAHDHARSRDSKRRFRHGRLVHLPCRRRSRRPCLLQGLFHSPFWLSGVERAEPLCDSGPEWTGRDQPCWRGAAVAARTDLSRLQRRGRSASD